MECLNSLTESREVSASFINRRGVRSNDHKWTFKTLGTCNHQRPTTQKGLEHLPLKGSKLKGLCTTVSDRQPGKLKDWGELLTTKEGYLRSVVDNPSNTVSTTWNIHTAWVDIQVMHRPNRIRLEDKWGGCGRQSLAHTKSCGHPYLGGRRQRMLPYCIKHHKVSWLV